MPIECSLDEKVASYEHACTKEGFKDFIAERLALANAISCDSTYTTGPYRGIEDYSELMVDDIFGHDDEDDDTFRFDTLSQYPDKFKKNSASGLVGATAMLLTSSAVLLSVL